MKHIAHSLTAVAALALLAGCNPASDLQGVDPVEYYEDHPIKSTMELRNQTVRVHFADGQNRLSPGEIEKLRGSLHSISMPAVESIQVGYPKDAKLNEARKTHLTRMLRNFGYSKDNYMFTPLPTLKGGEVQLDVTYASVVLPDCPDWRRSPVSTYSNSGQGNFKCAQEVNLGLMVADPHDLVRGSGGNIPIDSERAGKVLHDYRSGPAGAVSSSSGGSASASGGSTEGSSSTGSTGN